MRNIVVCVIMMVCLSSCARRCQELSKSTMGSRHYHVEQWSGVAMVHSYDFYATLNNQKQSDGYYWMVGDSLYEVSGSVNITSKP